MLITEKFTLQCHKGIPCVAFSTTYSDKPVVVTNYWHLTRESQPQSYWEALAYRFGTVLVSCSKGSGLFQDKLGYSWQKKDYCLVDGSKTIPIHTTEEPARMPKGIRNKQTYLWENGCWTCQTKTGKRDVFPEQFK